MPCFATLCHVHAYMGLQGAWVTTSVLLLSHSPFLPSHHHHLPSSPRSSLFTHLAPHLAHPTICTCYRPSNGICSLDFVDVSLERLYWAHESQCTWVRMLDDMFDIFSHGQIGTSSTNRVSLQPIEYMERSNIIRDFDFSIHH